MSVDLDRAVRYPLRTESWVELLVVGGVLTLLSVLVVPAILLYGYLLRVLRAGMTGADEPPAFDEWGDLFMEGLVATLIVLVYQALPLLVAVVTVGASVLTILTGTETGVVGGIVGVLGGLAVSTLLALVFGYVGLVGLANYAHTGRAAAAFDATLIRRVSLDQAYAVSWLYGAAALAVSVAAATLLGAVPILGFVAGAVVTFYGQVVAAWLWGRGFGASVTVDDPQPEPQP
jgi:hypothetical protein